MRHTLLPLKERKALRRDYIVRFVIVFCLLISSAMMISIVSLFPAYVHILNKEKSDIKLAKELSASKFVQERDRIEKVMKDDFAIVKRLSQDAGDYHASKALQVLTSTRGVTRFISFNYSTSGTSTVSILVKGISPSREELLSLKTRVGASFPTAKVDLPFSDLAKSKDINFSMKITYNSI